MGKAKPNSFLNFIVFILILILCWLLGRYFQFDVESFRAPLARYPLAISGFIFVLLYVVTTTFIWFGPKDVFRITGAILFGGVGSAFFVWIAEMINAVIMFSMSRYFGRTFVEQRLYVSSGDIDKVKKDTGFLGMLALRINPLVPFRLMDLGFGLSAVSLKKYGVASLIASFPRILWLQLILAGVGDALFKDPKYLVTYLLQHQEILMYSAIYFAVVIILTLCALIIKLIKKFGYVRNN